MDFVPVIILFLVVGLLVTFVRDDNRKRIERAGGGEEEEEATALCGLTHAAPEGGGKPAVGDRSNPLQRWLGFSPGHRRCASSGQWSFETVDGCEGEPGLLRDVATAQKWSLIYMVSPQGEMQAYDEQRARALEARIRTAYGDLDFQWAFASRLQFLGPVDRTGPAGETLGAFTKAGFDLQRLPEWERMECEKVVVASYDTPKSISGLVVGDGRLTRTETLLELKIAPLPFVRKADESTFYALEAGAGTKNPQATVQALKPISGDISSGELRAERYAVTDFLLAIFTQKVQSKGLTAEHLTVPAIKMVQTIEREPAFHGILQPLELDSWNVIDFTMDSMCEKDRSISEFLQAFMHWTYHRTNGELVLVVKKVAKDHEDGYWVVDPEIYAKDFSRFGSTTMGRDGMAAFLSTHRCNQLCERLIGGKPKGLDRTSKRDVSRRSIKDSAKGWSLSSFQSVRELESIDTGSSDRASPKVLKAVKCDFIPIWRALKRNKKV